MGNYYVLNTYYVLYFTYNTLHTHTAQRLYIQSSKALKKAKRSYKKVYVAIQSYAQLYKAIHSYT